MIPDLLVCGQGPAGRALAHRALAHGLTVTVVDPHPARRWTATYAAWADELPSWLPAHTIAATISRPVAWGTCRFEIDRSYVVFAVAALQDSLDITGASVIADRVEQIYRKPRTHTAFDLRRSRRTDSARPTLESEPVPLSDNAQLSGEPVAAGASDDSDTTQRSDRPKTAQPSYAPEALGRADGLERVRLSDGIVLRARRVIDARGVVRSPARAEQTAYGVVLQRDRWGEAIFMDWRPDNGAPAGAAPSFLYAVPLGADTMLLEETCLAGRPPLPIAELRDRLHNRLRGRGIELDGTEPVERVRFPLEGGRPGNWRFGAAGGYLHPATGYSIAAALAATDAVVANVSRRITDSTGVPGPTGIPGGGGRPHDASSSSFIRTPEVGDQPHGPSPSGFTPLSEVASQSHGTAQSGLTRTPELTSQNHGSSSSERARISDARAASASQLRAAILRPLSIRAVHRLRTAGLHALLALPPADLPSFFDAFFELPPAHQRAYLSGLDDLPGTTAAMAALFRALPWRMRRILGTATVGSIPTRKLRGRYR